MIKRRPFAADSAACERGQEQAYVKIQDAANAALRAVQLAVGPNGLLPSGDDGSIIRVGGTLIRLIGGRVINGIVEIASASRRGLP